VNDRGDRADDATGNIYVENGEIKNSGLCQSLPSATRRMETDWQPQNLS
jgi:hypothetical protein